MGVAAYRTKLVRERACWSRAGQPSTTLCLSVNGWSVAAVDCMGEGALRYCCLSL